jgi:diguanylate cyclase (GGDEF)-like protein
MLQKVGMPGAIQLIGSGGRHAGTSEAPARDLDRELARFKTIQKTRLISASLKFGRELEARFEAAGSKDRVAWLRKTIHIGVLLYNKESLTDYIYSPDLWLWPAIFRLCIATPLIYGFYAMIPRLDDQRRERLTAIVFFLAVASFGFFPMISVAPTAPLTYSACYIAVFFGTIVLPLRYEYVWIWVAGICAVWTAAAVSFSHPDWAMVYIMSVEFTVTVGIAVLTVHRMETGMRIQFLLAARDADKLSATAAERDSLVVTSNTDALTGAANRGFLDRTLDQCFGNAANAGRAMTMLMIDIDHFKQYNDHYGHQAGDHCLRLVAAELRRHLRSNSDFVARYGGEEFMVVLADIEPDAAAAVAGRICAAIRDLPIPHAGRSDGLDVLTISLGAASFAIGPDITATACINAADLALYAAKRAGRNRAAFSGELAA